MKTGVRVVQFIQAIGEFVASGCKTVPAAEYRQRLEVCQSCPTREGYTCGACGCLCSVKVHGAVWDCPENRWPIHRPAETG